jgi:electron transfer flavoprotein beta subunit
MKELQIIVCIKQIPDPEGPADAFKVDSEAKKVIPVGIPPVINPFDENALEAALRIKNQFDAKVTVLSMGEKLAQPVLRKALAAGADDLVLLMDQHFKDLDRFYLDGQTSWRLGFRSHRAAYCGNASNSGDQLSSEVRNQG